MVGNPVPVSVRDLPAAGPLRAPHSRHAAAGRAPAQLRLSPSRPAAGLSRGEVQQRLHHLPHFRGARLLSPTLPKLPAQQLTLQRLAPTRVRWTTPSVVPRRITAVTQAREGL